MRCAAVAALVVLVACGKGEDKAGAATPEAAVRGFFEATAAGDVARARTFLIGLEGCELVATQGGRKDECGHVIAEQRAWVTDAAIELKGARLTNVAVLPREEHLPPFASLVRVDFVIKGDDEREELAAIELDGRYYAAPMIGKKKAADAPMTTSEPQPATP